MRPLIILMVIDPTLVEKGVKFVVVGFSAFIIDFGTTYLLKEKVKANKYVANTTAFVISASYNFMLNRMWSFGSRDPEVARQAMMFALSMTTGLMIATGLIYIFSDKMKLNFYLSKLMAVSVVMVWNFCMNYFVIFSH